jgi:hypothetical protein
MDEQLVYQGVVRGGMVVLEAGARLAEGLQVIVQPADPHSADASLARGTNGNAGITMRNGVPVFPAQHGPSPPGIELVNQLRDDVP